MTHVLKRAVQVMGEGYPAGGPLKTIPKGTPAEDIPVSELRQLAAGHFVDGVYDEQLDRVAKQSDDVVDSEHVGAMAREEEANAAEHERIGALCEAKGLTLVGMDRNPAGGWFIRAQAEDEPRPRDLTEADL